MIPSHICPVTPAFFGPSFGKVSRFELESVPRGRQTDVRRAQALGHDTRKPELAGVMEQWLPVIVLQVFIEPQARPCLGQDRGERGLAHLPAAHAVANGASPRD